MWAIGTIIIAAIFAILSICRGIGISTGPCIARAPERASYSGRSHRFPSSGVCIRINGRVGISVVGSTVHIRTKAEPSGGKVGAEIHGVGNIEVYVSVCTTVKVSGCWHAVLEIWREDVTTAQLTLTLTRIRVIDKCIAGMSLCISSGCGAGGV